MAKPKSKKKEPNLKLSLAAAAIIAVLVLLYVIDQIKHQVADPTFIGILLILLMIGFLVLMVWLIRHILGRLKSN